MVTKIGDLPHLVPRGRAQPQAAFAEIRALAGSDHWQEREVAATGLVEIAKKQADAVVAELLEWAQDSDPNLRRAASEGLRGLARTRPEALAGVLELLRADPSPYVRKSVANLLRDMSRRHPAFVLGLCRRWVEARDPRTEQILRAGLRKLRETESPDGRPATRPSPEAAAAPEGCLSAAAEPHWPAVSRPELGDSLADAGSASETAMRSSR
ncbi:MAG TPA: HEAT repeat domain-containing protein [Thermoanaerobaculia bacterium]|nr:HEAT repeat domain-containing protein [Thermoanaerobaculia bacterium]